MYHRIDRNRTRDQAGLEISLRSNYIVRFTAAGGWLCMRIYVGSSWKLLLH